MVDIHIKQQQQSMLKEVAEIYFYLMDESEPTQFKKNWKNNCLIVVRKCIRLYDL